MSRRRAALVGGGVIGGGWAARFIQNGWDVVIVDPDPAAQAVIADVLTRARNAARDLYDAPLPAEGTLSFAREIGEAVEGAHWVQESVPERLPLKHEVIRAVQTAAPGAMLCSSTSGFTPSQLQQGAPVPERILVAHPFNPVYLLPLVEIVGSAHTPPNTVDRAKAILTGLGMYPLVVRKEIDAHIADRLLEAVWREALWLVKDGVATTEDIDEAIRMGFGLRWAQMGLFETYRCAGGPDGMRHFLAQFGPALAWPWTKLMDVPELDDALIDKIAAQSDAQSGARTIPQLLDARDRNLVAILRALRSVDAGAGQVLRTYETGLRAQPKA